jgi:hypothetical protein
MKKGLLVLYVCLTMLSYFSCASNGSGSVGGTSQSKAGKTTSNSRVPDFVKTAMADVGEDELIGIGAAKMSSISMSMTTASTRARAAISQQLNTMVKNMVTDYTAEMEGTPESAVNFQENITVALSQSKLVGSHVVTQDEGSDGTYWVVISMSKSDVAKEINNAVADAARNNAALKAFDASARMDAAFAKIAGEEAVVVEK